jgi:hypothetical protein
MSVATGGGGSSPRAIIWMASSILDMRRVPPGAFESPLF